MFTDEHRAELRDLEQTKNFLNDRSNYRQLRDLSRREKQQNLSAIVFRLKDFDGKDLYALRTGDYMVATFLFQILDIWTKLLKKMEQWQRESPTSLFSYIYNHHCKIPSS
jgi:hypothetical protein